MSGLPLTDVAGDDDDDGLQDRAALLTPAARPRPGRRRPRPRPTSGAGRCLALVKTLAICLAFFSLGLCIALPGPTLLDLRDSVGAPLRLISQIFLWRALGYLAGSMLSGLLFDRLNRLVMMLLSILLAAAGMAAVPWMRDALSLNACFAAVGVPLGFVDTGGNVLLLDLWGKSSGPYMQAIHFSFGLGAFVAPLLAVPFLSAAPLATLPAMAANGSVTALMGRAHLHSVPVPEHLALAPLPEHLASVPLPEHLVTPSQELVKTGGRRTRRSAPDSDSGEVVEEESKASFNDTVQAGGGAVNASDVRLGGVRSGVGSALKSSNSSDVPQVLTTDTEAYYNDTDMATEAPSLTTGSDDVDERKETFASSNENSQNSSFTHSPADVATTPLPPNILDHTPKPKPSFTNGNKLAHDQTWARPPLKPSQHAPPPAPVESQGEKAEVAASPTAAQPSRSEGTTGPSGTAGEAAPAGNDTDNAGPSVDNGGNRTETGTSGHSDSQVPVSNSSGAPEPTVGYTDQVRPHEIPSKPADVASNASAQTGYTTASVVQPTTSAAPAGRVDSAVPARTPAPDSPAPAAAGSASSITTEPTHPTAAPSVDVGTGADPAAAATAPPASSHVTDEAAAPVTASTPSPPQSDTQERPPQHPDTQGHTPLQPNSQGYPPWQPNTQQGPPPQSDTQERPPLQSDTQERPAPQTDTQERPAPQTDAQERPPQHPDTHRRHPQKPDIQGAPPQQPNIQGRPPPRPHSEGPPPQHPDTQGAPPQQPNIQGRPPPRPHSEGPPPQQSDSQGRPPSPSDTQGRLPQQSTIQGYPPPQPTTQGRPSPQSDIQDGSISTVAADAVTDGVEVAADDSVAVEQTGAAVVPRTAEPSLTGAAPEPLTEPSLSVPAEPPTVAGRATPPGLVAAGVNTPQSKSPVGGGTDLAAQPAAADTGPAQTPEATDAAADQQTTTAAPCGPTTPQRHKPGTYDDTSEEEGFLWRLSSAAAVRGVPLLAQLYLLSAGCLLVVALIFLALLVYDPRAPRAAPDSGAAAATPRCYTATLVSLMALVLCFYVGMEVAMGQLLMNFSVHASVHMTRAGGAYVTSVFWGLFATGRALSVCFAGVMRPSVVLALDYGLVSAGAALLLAAGSWDRTALMAGCSLTGLGMSSVFPAALVWLEQHVHVTSRLAAVLVVSGAVGEMAMPAGVGALMATEPLALVYTLAGCVVVCLLAQLAATVAARTARPHGAPVGPMEGYQLAAQEDDDDVMISTNVSSSW